MMGMTGSKLSNALIKMFENSSEAIFFFDDNGSVLAMNPAAEETLDQEIIDKIINSENNAFCQSCFGYTNEEDLLSCINCYLKNPEKDFSSFQVHLKTRNNGIMPFSASFKTIDKEQGIRVLTLMDLTNQYRTRETLYRTNMMKYIIKAQEDERKRISRELHDSVAQELLSVLVELRVMKYMNLEEDAINKLKRADIALTRLLDDIRNLSVELRPASLDDLGLEAAFRSHFNWVEKNYGMLVNFSSELSEARYTSEAETVVYRVCQEAILNAIKYAGTDEIDVRLFEEDQEVRLIVEDEGTGFNMNAMEIKGTGLGLYGMRERAELANGNLMIKTELDKGTTIELRIPILRYQTEGNDEE